MSYMQFLTEVINDGIDAARADYATKPSWLSGALLGFELCRGKRPTELLLLLNQVRTEVSDAFKNEAAEDPYWKVRCKEAEIEWVCNCVSALRHLPVASPLHVEFYIVQPTARGVLKAHEVLRRVL